MDKESILKLEFYYKEQHIHKEVDAFYSDPQHRALFEKHIVPLLEQEAECGSIRSLESFIGTYLRDTNHVVIANGIPINTLALYLQRIKHDFSRFMDPVGRREKQDWKKADGKTVKTTVCQLKYFKFFIEYGLLEPLLEKYYAHLKQQQQQAKKDKKKTVSKKKKEVTTMYVYVHDETILLPAPAKEKPDVLLPATTDQNWDKQAMESLMYVYEQQTLPFLEDVQLWEGDVMQ